MLRAMLCARTRSAHMVIGTGAGPAYWLRASASRTRSMPLGAMAYWNARSPMPREPITPTISSRLR